MAATSGKRRLTFEVDGMDPFTMAVFPGTTSAAVKDLVASKVDSAEFDVTDADGDLVAHTDLASLPTGTYAVKKVAGGAATAAAGASGSSVGASLGGKRKRVGDGPSAVGGGKRKKADGKQSQLIGTRFLKRFPGYGVYSGIVRSYDAAEDEYTCSYGELGAEAEVSLERSERAPTLDS